MKYDKIILGAGIYGLYSALFCGARDEKILVIECDAKAFGRATYINQARVHMGYHYPRSLSTAMKSASYFERFNRDFSFCINREFKQVYATSARLSWSDSVQFKKFCEAARIPCEEVDPGKYFNEGMCDGAFLTKEYTYDAIILKDYFLEKLSSLKNVEIKYNCQIQSIVKLENIYEIHTNYGIYVTSFLLNATYASSNQILELAREEKFGIKYELCEIILCRTNHRLKGEGITVMDGPFFSIMPFGKTGMHSLTSVAFTPHKTSYSEIPVFECQIRSKNFCTGEHLGNCNECPAKPITAYPYMLGLARKYIRSEYEFQYADSLYSMKPILKSSEIDDSRPTVIRVHSKTPFFISVLSGKINTVYDLEDVLINE